jgi:hypothetical protein
MAQNEMFQGFSLTPLPDGRVLVTYPRQRQGFTVPEATLLGTFANMEAAKDAITESLAS